ncbi:MAG: hypothetical protein AAGB28_03845, partial [Pseudomonadota bacterium]
MRIEKKVWLISGLLTVGLAGLLLALWMDLNHFEGDPTQLPDQAAVDTYLGQLSAEPDYRVRTGIFIKSFGFIGASDVQVSGYIWQHYQNGIHDAIKPSTGETGFVLPEAVDVANGVIEEMYRLPQP